MHKSAKFWRENALRLNEKNYDLLRTLIHFLEVSKDPLVLAVASYDIGEYVRHNPRGKQLVLLEFIMLFEWNWLSIIFEYIQFDRTLWR